MMKVWNMISALAIILITAMLFASCGTTATPTEATQTATETTALQTEATPTSAATESANAAQATQNTATEPISTEALQEQPQNNDKEPDNEAEQPQDDQNRSLQMTIGGTPVSVTWEDNDAVQALRELCKDQPLTIQMSMYGGFEQVGSIGYSLPQNDVQTITSAGDIVLYSGNQMVVFYGSNTWAYTRLGHITDQSADDMAALLSNGDTVITVSLG